MYRLYDPESENRRKKNEGVLTSNFVVSHGGSLRASFDAGQSQNIPPVLRDRGRNNEAGPQKTLRGLVDGSAKCLESEPKMTSSSLSGQRYASIFFAGNNIWDHNLLKSPRFIVVARHWEARFGVRQGVGYVLGS